MTSSGRLFRAVLRSELDENYCLVTSQHEKSIPSVGDDDVVKGRVGAPEAREPHLDHHFVDEDSGSERGSCGAASFVFVVIVLVSRVDVARLQGRWMHRPSCWKFWTPARPPRLGSPTNQSDALLGCGGS